MVVVTGGLTGVPQANAPVGFALKLQTLGGLPPLMTSCLLPPLTWVSRAVLLFVPCSRYVLTLLTSTWLEDTGELKYLEELLNV